MGDKALACFLGGCVQLLQVLMEVFVQACSLSQLLKSTESQNDWELLVLRLMEPSGLQPKTSVSHMEEAPWVSDLSLVSTLWTKKTPVSL